MFLLMMLRLVPKNSRRRAYDFRHWNECLVHFWSTYFVVNKVFLIAKFIFCKALFWCVWFDACHDFNGVVLIIWFMRKVIPWSCVIKFVFWFKCCYDSVDVKMLKRVIFSFALSSMRMCLSLIKLIQRTATTQLSKCSMFSFKY